MSRGGFLHRALLYGLLRHPWYVLTGRGREPDEPEVPWTPPGNERRPS